MKFKILSVSLIIVLLLSVVGSIFAYASVSNKETYTNETEVLESAAPVADIDEETAALKDGETFVRSNIDKQKSIRLNDQTIELTYKESEKIHGIRVYDNYVGDDGDYSFDRNGVLVCRDNYKGVKQDVLKAMSQKENKIDEEQAIKIAREFINTDAYEITKDYELAQCTYNESLAMYFVDFAKTYNGFIRSETVFVKITALGKPISWNCVGFGEQDDFDSSTIVGITEKDVEDYAKTQIEGIYGDSLTHYSISDHRLEKLNGEYVISFTATVKWLDENGVELANARTMYYEI